MGYYTPSKNKFLVPYSDLEFVEIAAQGTSNVWKPTGKSGQYFIGGNPVTGRANDSSRGASSFILHAKNINTLSDVSFSSEDGSQNVSFASMNASQGSYYGEYDPYAAGENIVEIQTTSLGGESEDRQYGGQITLNTPDQSHINNVSDVTLTDNDGNTFIAKNAIEIAKDPIVDPTIEGSMSNTVIKNNSTIEITGENLYYADFVNSENILEGVFHSSPIDHCAKIFFEFQSGIRIDNKNWRMVFKTLPPDPNILTGIKRGENKLVYLLNNGVKTIQISGNFRYLHEPEISGYTPKTGIWGEEILVSGSEFYGITGVKVGEHEVENFVVSPDTGIKFNLPNETTTDHIYLFGSGGSTSTEETNGKYGTEEFSYNLCTHKHGSCERTGVGVDEFENYYAAAYTLDTKNGWEGAYGTPITPFNVGYKSGVYKLKFSARQGRLVNTLYSGYSITGKAHPTGKKILEGRNCSWMWAVIKNATGFYTGSNSYRLGEGNTWETSGELKFSPASVGGEVLASGHANGFGYLASDTGIKDFRDKSFNPVGNWTQIWGADKTNQDYLPYEISLTGIDSQDNLSLWIRGHSSAPSDYQKNQLDSITGVTGLDLRLSDKISYENYLAQLIEFEKAPICPLPPNRTVGGSGIQWLVDNDIPNVVYIGCFNWSHVYSGEHYNSLKSNIGMLEVREPDIEIVDFNPKVTNHEKRISISGKSLHRVSDIRFSGKNGHIITLSKSYEISGLSQFTGHATTGISLSVPLNVEPNKTFTIIESSGFYDLQSHTSPVPLDIIKTGLVSVGGITGKYQDTINVSGTHLNNVDFYFKGYTPDEENQNYIKSLETTLISGTGAYLKVPKEIITSNIYISGNGFFEKTDQRFTVIPSISGMDKEKYYVGDNFRITGVNCSDSYPFFAITGYNKVSQDNSINLIITLDNNRKLIEDKTHINMLKNPESPELGYSKLSLSDQLMIGYYGVDNSSLTGNYPESIETGYNIITGTIPSQFLGTGEPFLVSYHIGAGSYFSASSYLSGIKSSISSEIIDRAPPIEISGKKPIISGVAPENGAPAIPITISGSNFLNVTGVKFVDEVASLDCHVPKTGYYGASFIEGMKLIDLYNDPYEDQVHSVQVYPCDWGSTTGEIVLLDHEYNN